MQFKLKYFLISLFSLSLITINGLSPVSAQESEAADSESFGIEEIIVTARKIEESAQDVPVAITAITEQLQKSNIRNLSDLQGFAPNVIIGNFGSRSGGANLNIRGISPPRSDDNSFDAPIAVMIDGVHLGTAAGQILENFDLERVEVLRGPQGTLFGKNTVGGVISVVRSRPTGEFGARLKATIGEDGQQELRAVVNFPIAEGKVAGKVFGTMIEDDGWLPNITLGKKVPEKDYMNYGLTLLFTPNDKFEATVTVETFDDQSDLAAFHYSYNFATGVDTAPTDPRQVNTALATTSCAIYGACRNSLAIPSYAENDTNNDAALETDAITINASYEINENSQLVYVGSTRDTSEYRIYDYDGSAAPFITIERWNDYEQTSHELRYERQTENSTLIAGYYFWNSEFTQDWVTGGEFWRTLFGAVAQTPALWGACQGTNGLDGAFAPIACDLGIQGGIPAPGIVTQILYETQETESEAFFLNYEYDLTDKLALNAGIRWTEEWKAFKAGQSYLSNVERSRERNFPGYADLYQKWDEVSPRVGLTYRIDEDKMVYASYSEGFKSGGFFGVNQNIRDFERDQYDPEFASNIELGFKSTLMENRLRLNLTAFRNEFEDKQESFVALDPDTKTVQSVFNNAAEVLYEGFEVEALFAATRNLQLFLNYGSLDASYEEFFTDINQFDGLGEIEDASFLEPRNAPEYTLGVGFQYNAPIANGELELYFKYSETGETQTSLLNLASGAFDGTEDVSANIGYYQDNWSVVIFGRNLTDDQYEVPTLLGGSFTSGPLFSVSNAGMRPRAIGIELGYEF
jgi:iron complex outermembrane receptor protein